MNRVHASALFVAFSSAACAASPAVPCPVQAPSVAAVASTNAAPQAALPAVPAAPPAPVPPAPSDEPPAAFSQALAAAKKAIASGDYAGADHQLLVAAQAGGDSLDAHFDVARFRATRFLYAGDAEHAAAALVAVIPELAKHPESADEFWAHNMMMMIRESQGDPAAALAENDQATIAAARGAWEPKERETLAYLKDRWHRAYLSRMLAETRTGSARQALVQYAVSAFVDYRARALSLGSNDESVAVLESYFAALDGNHDAALQAARRVDPAKDDDLEDLYLVVVGLDAGGDHAAAEAVRQRMRQSTGVHLARPIMLRWVERDAKGARARGFSPLHPS